MKIFLFMLGCLVYTGIMRHICWRKLGFMVFGTDMRTCIFCGFVGRCTAGKVFFKQLKINAGRYTGCK
jgi:hypothetical protein